MTIFECHKTDKFEQYSPMTTKGLDDMIAQAFDPPLT